MFNLYCCDYYIDNELGSNEAQREQIEWNPTKQSAETANNRKEWTTVWTEK